MATPPRALVLAALACLCQSPGCVATSGLSAGVEIDTSGELSVLTRAWFQSGGSHIDHEGATDSSARSEWGAFYMPQMGLGLGWSVSHNGPIFGLSLPFFGALRVNEAETTVISARLMPEMKFIIPIDDAFRFNGDFGLMVNWGTVVDREMPYLFGDDEPWDYRIHGVSLYGGARLTSSDNDNDTNTDVRGVFFVGALREYVDFFDVELSEDSSATPQESRAP